MATRKAPLSIFHDQSHQSPTFQSPSTYHSYQVLDGMPHTTQSIGLSSHYPHHHSISPPTSQQHPSSVEPWTENFISHSPVIPPPHGGHFSTDDLPKKQMYSHQHSLEGLKQHVEPFPTFSPQPQFDKENVYTLDAMGQNAFYAQKPVQKRKSSIAPLGDRGQKKQKKPSGHASTSSSPMVLPDPSSLPPVEDDGNKPSFSYSQLIAMAILRAPNRRLTLAQIYKWISDSFSFYRRSPDGGPGWQNSVRHNLSLNKAFMKVERPKDNPGKGHYWCIQPGHEGQFLKEKQKPGSLNSSFSTAQARRSSTVQASPFPSGMMRTVDSAKFPDDEELSSDATIPASDPAIHDGVAADDISMPPPARFPRSSPPPAIHSSPPQLPAIVRDSTPPPVPRFAMPTSRPNGGRKRKLSNAQTGLGDSGYYSSIESSAIRNPRPYLTSEIDAEHPINKRGRAEEELARIRSSSYDSPLKTRPNILVSSSPSHPQDMTSTSHGPITPALIFKKPLRPPHSVSPNTNLRNHRHNIRKLLGSPDRTLNVMESPFVTLEAPNYELFALASNFDYPDVTVDVDSPSRIKRGLSPERRSIKRPRLERANTMAGVLADITGTKSNSRLSVPPILSPGKLRSPRRLGQSPTKKTSLSPMKQMIATDIPSLLDSPQFLQQTLFEATTTKSTASPEKDDNDIFAYALNLPSDDSEGGVDILQGFARIGEATTNHSKSPRMASNDQENYSSLLMPEQFLMVQQSPSRPPRSSRPGLGRSSTTFF